jgi:hypothetical protein
MEQERRLDAANRLDAWKEQKHIVDELVAEYLNALTDCRLVAEQSGRSHSTRSKQQMNVSV